MMGIYEALSMALVVSCVVAGVGSVYYVAWWMWARRGARTLSRSAQAAVRREAVWGIVLALPLSLLILTSVSQPGGYWWAVVLGVVGVAAFNAIPVAAIQGRRLPKFVRWIPAAIAIALVPLLMLASTLSDDFGWFYLLILFVFAAGLGAAYAADCIVAVRFARAAREVERASGPTRAFAKYRPAYVAVAA
jgi:hypothetical protein